MRISDWSSDVCSSDLADPAFAPNPAPVAAMAAIPAMPRHRPRPHRCTSRRHSGTDAHQPSCGRKANRSAGHWQSVGFDTDLLRESRDWSYVPLFLVKGPCHSPRKSEKSASIRLPLATIGQARQAADIGKPDMGQRPTLLRLFDFINGRRTEE